MKGLLTVAAVPFRKTHNLDELAEQVATAFPELAGRVAPLRWQTSWGFAFRYPSPGEPAEPAPAPEEIAGVLADIDALREELAARLA